MVEFAANEASIITTAMLQKDISKLFISKICIRHSLALAVSHATNIMPSHLKTLLANVYHNPKFFSKHQNSLQ